VPTVPVWLPGFVTDTVPETLPPMVMLELPLLW
jgi:hypothetical protein